MNFLEINNTQKKISFGSGMERPTFPDEIAHDRFGNEMNPNKGVKAVGPGQYDNHEKTTFTNFNQKISLKGYIIGARTSKRSFSPILTSAPPSTTYQNEDSDLQSKKAFKPFNFGDERFNNRVMATVPGPGAYELDVEKNRKVQMIHSFGGQTHLMPIVETKCITAGSDKCENCSLDIFGDYFVSNTHVLCSKCFDYNWKWQEKYSRSFLSSFKKARDCKSIHDHQGTTAAIMKTSSKEIKKLKQKEAYLSLYWA